ncbi:auxilin-like protein 1 isoform X2 [Cornus florida]|uniref:auxilin-like protein 1 isoform X2 n=1 Tax=Cornus florida TaxID=4283 RepID=UPI0028996471|nr:auxilin-like protein 1 isoform X2 [Cornus florida]
MENLSHSPPKKTHNASGFATKTIYDDVFGGPPRFGAPTLSPRAQDYTEIFGSFHVSRASSVPILDLPVVVETPDASFDVRRSDYSEVFGGFNGLDFAHCYEESCSQLSGGDDSSEEAWTPAQSDSLSDESDPSACFENNQSLSNGDSHQAFDEIKQFNISYYKANQRSKEDMSNGAFHVTQLHAVPSYTSVVDETLRKTEDKNPPFQVTDDLNLISMNCSAGIREGKQFRKTMSHPLNSSFGIQTFGSDCKPLKGYSRTDPPPNDRFVTMSNVNLKTQPSQVSPPLRSPPALAVKQGDSGRQNSRLKASKSYAFERTAGDCSPPFFDVEVDTNSSAAASAAAMKDAMEKAQAKLRNAKELMERKKEGLQCHAKLGLKNDIKDEGNPSKIFNALNSSKDERLQGTCNREHSEMKGFAGEGKQEVMKSTQLVSESTEGERHIKVANKSAKEKHGKEYKSSQASHKIERTVAWREETEFYELVKTDNSQKVFKQAKDEKILLQSAQFHERGQEKRAAFDLQEEYSRKGKAASEGNEWGKSKSKLEVAEGACEWEESKGLPKVTKVSHKQEEHGKKVQVAQEAYEQEEEVNKLRVSQRHQGIEMILTEADECGESENPLEVEQKENEVEIVQKLKKTNESVENEKTLKDALGREENDKKLEEILEGKNNDKRLKEAIELEENGKRLMEVLERKEKEKQQKEARERGKNEKRQEEAFEREENENRLEKALEGKLSEKRLKMALEQVEIDKREKLARERETNEKRLVKALKREENEKKLKDALEQEECAKKQKEAHEREKNEEGLNEAREREEKEKRLEEAWVQEENKKRLQEDHEREESERRSKEAFKQGKFEKKSERASKREETEILMSDAGNWVELKGQSKNHDQSEKLKLNKKTSALMEGNSFKAFDVANKLGNNKNLPATQVACKHDKSSKKSKVTEEDFPCKKGKLVQIEPQNSEGESQAVEMENGLIDERFNSYCMDHDDLQHKKNQIRTDNATESLHLHDSVTKSGEGGISVGQTYIERNKEASKLASNPGNRNMLTHERGDRGAHIKDAQVAFDQEESKDKLMPLQVDGGLVQNGRKMGTAPSDALGGNRIAQEGSTSQNTERKENNLNEALTPEEREVQERTKRERKLKKDQLRKIEEEKEREKDRLRKIEEEREKEKDRMIVERATREARERAFAEARERAERTSVERATAEVRQRAMAEARERLEKVCAEARERSSAEKASMEARLRAERAAVERATAEARERAFEKAMAEKATYEARERLEKSIAEKSSASSRDGGFRQSSSSSDLQFQSVGSFSGSRYSYSSTQGVEGEPAQRCKARLERHRRTAERAAKALAEKNMRDLLAQREQAERNRLAETLGAEVKRWSNGKEGNLRALLSTLQYILGPDSGWQPVPLTEVITAAAVKKAYRKATLCVHPDKLQQRGASIQQKYICEKVFDLLKDAWNKFNSVEW